MSMFDTVKQTLADLPISDIQKARLELAMDESAALLRKLTDLQTENGRVQALLFIATSERDKALKSLSDLEQLHAEDIRIHKAIEFRKGKRTGNEWTAFCPACKMPVIESEDKEWAVCTGGCGWTLPLRNGALSHLIKQLR